MTAAELPGALTSPDAYPFEVEHVELRETHISWVFLAGARVYKVKKPVRLSFLDYSTAERRRFFCEEEVRLNARLAPGIYRRVVTVSRMPSGRLRLDGAGRVEDYAVEMERLPADRMMDRLLAVGEISNEPLERLVAVLVEFHRHAATGRDVDVHGEPAAVRRLVLGNLGECPRDLDPTLHDALGARLARLLTTLEGVVGARVKEGRCRDGHGDLHAGNLCFLPERVVGYDCVEFEPAFRCGDVANDLAFLVMDLHARGFPAFGEYLAHRYAVVSGDASLARVLPLYLVHRALVRCKVAWLRASATEAPAANDPARLESVRYLGLAAGFLAPRALLVVCGLPGTGKSTIAAALEHAVNGVVLSSDRIRKRLVGLEPTEHWRGDPDGGPYAPGWTHRTYDEMYEQAQVHLAAGRTVILDATFPVAEWRARFTALAPRHGAVARVLSVEAPAEVVEERLRARALDPTAVSDAGVEVYRRARARFEPPGPEESAPVVVLDARRPADDSTLAVLASLLAPR